MKVLIVEDEILLAMNTQADLESMGYRVVGIAESSEVALDIISKHSPELVLMDIVIQGHMNGIELARTINDKYPHCRVIYMTAHADRDTVSLARQTRHAGILNKPVEPYKLKQVLSQMIN